MNEIQRADPINIPMQDVKDMASAIAKSGLFGVNSQDQAFALMLIAQAQGRHPATIAQEYDIIQGRPALKSTALLARFQLSGGTVKWDVNSDHRVVGTFAHPQGGSITVEWTLEKARQAGIAGKDNWKKYPSAMMRARCIAEGVRAVFPACCVGEYVPEEVQDFKPREVRAEVVNENPFGSLEVAEAVHADNVAKYLTEMTKLNEDVLIEYLDHIGWIDGKDLSTLSQANVDLISARLQGFIAKVIEYKTGEK